MNAVKKSRSFSEMTLEELQEKRRELQFMGSQYGLSGCPTPDALTTEWEALERELARRTSARPN